MNPDDFDNDSIEDIVSKPNRNKQEEAEDQQMIVGPRPPSGIHALDRKTRDKRRNLTIKKLIK